MREQRARRAPVLESAAPAAPAGIGHRGQARRSANPGAPAFSQMPLAVVAVPVREARLTLEAEALGTARANESVDVTAKVSNLVTAMRFAEGQQVRRGQVLVELDGREARAELAVAEAALSESRSQFKRSRELYTTHVLSEAQLEQIEATLKANEARVAAARSRLSDTVISRAVRRSRRAAPRERREPRQPGHGDHDARRHKHDQARLHGAGDAPLVVSSRGLAIVARSVAYPGEEFAGKVASVDSRVDPTTRSVTVRALLPNDRRRCSSPACS